MERKSLLNRETNQNGELTPFFFTMNKEEEITVQERENLDVLVNDILPNSSLNININKDARLNIAFLNKKNANNVKITAKVHQNAQISLFFADFSAGGNKVNITVDLLEEEAKADWHLSSLASEDDNKEFSVYVNHLAPHTFATSDNYGVCKDKAKLVFSGTSLINKGCVKSDTRQNAKIMVFDKDSIAIAKPILKIDENDLVAAHSAVVGKINDEHLFYLTSRGLSEKEAKELIIYGYLKPIVKGFIDDKDKEEISSLIEEKVK